MAQLGADQGQSDPQLARHVQACGEGQVQRLSLTPRTTPPNDVLVVLPTYNESQNLEKVVAGVRPLGHEVLVVDDSSPDGTADIADRLAAAATSVPPLHLPPHL